MVIVAARTPAACATDFDDPTDASVCCHDGAEMFEVVRRLPRGLVDAVVAGHTHSGGRALSVNGVPIVQALLLGASAFSRVDLTVNWRSRRWSTARRIHPAARRLRPRRRPTPAAACRRRASASVRGHATKVVAVAASRGREPRRWRRHWQRVDDAAGRAGLGVALDGPSCSRQTAPTSLPLGNLFADALRDAAPGADAAIGYSAGPGRPARRPGRRSGDRGRGLRRVPVRQPRRARSTVTGTRARTDDAHQPIAAAALPRALARRVGAAASSSIAAPAMLAVEVRRASGEPLRATNRLVLATTDFMAARLTAGADPEAGRLRPPPGAYHDAPLVREVAAQWIPRAGRHAARRPIRGSRAPALDTHRASHDRLSGATARLVSRPRSSLRIWPAMHPAWPCCSFRKYRPGFSVRRALPAGRLAALGAQRTSGTRR